jgi:hypothetical protein
MQRSARPPLALVHSRDLPAALQLTEIAEKRQVVLPLSARHEAETTKWGDDGRPGMPVSTPSFERLVLLRGRIDRAVP